MTLRCPYCQMKSVSSSDRPKIVRLGRFWRKSDGRWVQRFRCLKCVRGFSFATFHPCYRQNKRQFNDPLRKLFASGMSQRRAAIVLNLSRTTVVRKLLFLSTQAEIKNDSDRKSFLPAATVEFDDVETFEHTKLKPLSITLVVESKSRRILGFEVSQMPAKGVLALASKKKYGPRKDARPLARARLFSRVRDLIQKNAEIKSDQNPHYPSDVRRYFPLATHRTFKGRRGCVVGQGELKRGGFDPLFSFNHTAAMLRANINRLFRKTWCTTKKPERLRAHLEIYVEFHNRTLLSRPA